MSDYTLTELQYSQDRKGPFKLYIYEPDSPYHRGGVWFQRVPQTLIQKDRKRRKRPGQREKNAAQRKRWRKQNHEKTLAHLAVQSALRSGKLVKPKRCESCGAKRLLEGHHPDHRKKLQVEWVCHPCHRRIHRRIN